MANASGNYPRILMGPTGGNKDIIQLARSLEEDNCTVHTFDSMPVEVTMTKFDMAVLVVTDHDPLSLESTDHRIQRILHAAGFLEARLAPDRVCLLVEDAVDELQAPPVTQIRYPTGEPMSGKGELVKFIQAQYPRVHRDLHRQEPIREQAHSDELRIPWAMLVAVALAALIPIVLLARTLGGDDEIETITDVASQLETGQVAAPVTNQDSAGATADATGDLATGAGSTDDGLQLGESEGSAEGSDGGSAPADDAGTGTGTGDDSTTGPTLTPRNDGASDATSGTPAPSTTTQAARLPATCTVDVRKSLLLAGSYECDGGGRLAVEGFEGPWHNEIAEIQISTGATGSLVYEAAGTVPLQAGNIILDPDAAAYGVNTISVTFTAEGQHVHLVQRPSQGGQSVTLTFVLN